ncbi:arylsulfatase [uncultured Pseudoteredinibacter sp.]|uniref:arylsulfatase n=1 Tax=uncultured Pseudoteredinibacter sp. TaxID=1641701 RepID=UPI002603747B|nr:arylsulfatase [uncultured Pseudoteredinibacter sp.]
MNNKKADINKQHNSRALWLQGLIYCSAFLCLQLALLLDANASSQPPNILLVVADDLGYGDLGYLGSEIKTPNIDRLAAQGAQFKDFHTAFTCSPTRAMLLTGVDSHLAGLGNMAEEMADNQRGQPGYEGYLNQRVESVASILKNAGYDTYMTGKWHLGKGEGKGPESHGFDRSFVLLPGGASHYGDMKPAYAIKKGQKALYREDGKLLSALPKSFKYSSEFYVDQLMEYIAEGKQNNTEKPFFAYLAFTAPHWPLQAPKSAIEKYQGRYEQGFEVLHQARFKKQKDLGLINGEAAKMPKNSRRWNCLSDKEKRRSAKSMEIYAAMVSEMDRHLGRMLNSLEQAKELENTIVLFLSDNGAEGHDLDATWPPQQFPKVNRWIRQNHDFAMTAMGDVDSYVLYGPEWAWAGAPAFHGYKGYASEGGSHVPALISFPGKIKPGQVDQLVRVKDMVPTLLQLAGIKRSAEADNEQALHPITGRSVVPALQGEKMAPVSFISELFAKRVVRFGDWKATHMPKPIGREQWQLFNVTEDRAERHDLAKQHPKKLKELIALWDDYAQKNKVILPNWVSGY